MKPHYLVAAVFSSIILSLVFVLVPWTVVSKHQADVGPNGCVGYSCEVHYDFHAYNSFPFPYSDRFYQGSDKNLSNAIQLKVTYHKAAIIEDVALAIGLSFAGMVIIELRWISRLWHFLVKKR